MIEYEPLTTSEETLEDNINEMGFEAKIKRAGFKDTVVHIKGMTCMSCVRNIEGNISAKPGIKFIKVSLDQKLAYVKFDPGLTSHEGIRNAIDDMGFEASLDTLHADIQPKSKSVIIRVEGMTCHSCVNTIEGSMCDKPGVKAIKVSLEQKQAMVEYDASATNPEALREQIDDIGFEATLPPILLNGVAEFDPLVDLSAPPQPIASSCEVSIEGMTCNSCVKSIEGNISGVDGIKEIKVSLAEKIGRVHYDPKKLTGTQIAEKIDDMGFDAKLIEYGQDLDEFSELATERGQEASCEVSIEGMTCNSCVRNIEGHIGKVEGISSIKVSLQDKMAHIRYSPRKLSPDTIADKIDDMGFDAKAIVPLSMSNLQNQGELMGTMKVTLKVKGMTCQTCVRAIEGKIGNQAGVEIIKVSLPEEKADITFNPATVNSQQLRDMIDDMGFESSFLTSK